MQRFLCKTTALLFALGCCSILQAQAQPSIIWEERTKERFKRIVSSEKLLISQAQPQDSGLKKRQLKRVRRILVFYRCEGFIHTSIPHANFALQEMARKSKAFSVDLEDEYEVFNKKNLKQYHAILFNSTSALKFADESQRKAILDFVRGGGGLIGIHGASDNFYEWEAGAEMMGGQFNGHPWTAGGTWAFKVDDPTHPLNQAFGGRGFWHQDEIYQYLPSSFVGPENLRILVSLDMSKETVREPMNMEKFERFNSKYPAGNREVPVSWVRDIGKGRLFYTNFGHREDSYKNPVIMQHIFDGILFAIGYKKVDTTPTAELPPIAPALALAKE